MKKQLLLLVILLSMVGTKALAYDIAVKNADGVTIYYNYINDGTELEVAKGRYNGSVVIPEEVTYMNITQKVTSIGNYAFYDCSRLTSVTIPNSVTSIGDSAFRGCSSLTSVTIPNSVTCIGGSAFYDCSSLTSVTIGNSVTSIGNGAFEGCYRLTSVTIPNSVTSIGNYAFQGCTSLTSVTIPESVTSIGDNAFEGCDKLSNVNIPVNDFAAFCNNKIVSLICQKTSYSVPISLIDSEGKEIKDYTIPDGVTSIGEGAFSGCSRLTSITIPNSVTSIGKSAFKYCSSLPSITIGNSVTSIGNYAFQGCTSLTSVTIPESVTSIGEGAFWSCDKLSNVNISVNDYAAFCNNRIVYLIRDAIKTSESLSLIDSEGKEIKEYSIPDGVTSIGYSAFYRCSGLTSITIPNSVTSIGGAAFFGCTALISITIPESVTSIGEGAFNSTGWYNNQSDGILYLCNWLLGYKGDKLTGEQQIANGTKHICTSALSGCKGLTSITIPNSVTSIGQGAFQYCSGLTSITIGNSVKSIGIHAFSDCKMLKSVTIGNGVTNIRGGAFSYCDGLTSIVIPNSVTSIDDYAFSYCSHLASVTLSKNLNSIGSNAFYNCGRLAYIYCLNPVPPSTNDDTFICQVNNYVRDKNDIYTYANLYVPKGSKDAYSAASEWRYFKNIKEIDGDSEQVDYANLTIQLGTTGFTRQSVKTRESYSFYIGSYGNNKVNAVTFNGEDVTNRMNNGYYTTPEITGASILSVTYETTASAIQAMEQSNLKVRGYKGEINVENIDSVSDVAVYTVDGRLVDSIPSAIGSARLQVPSNQLYIVKVANRTFKLAM